MFAVLASALLTVWCPDLASAQEAEEPRTARQIEVPEFATPHERAGLGLVAFRNHQYETAESLLLQALEGFREIPEENQDAIEKATMLLVLTRVQLKKWQEVKEAASEFLTDYQISIDRERMTFSLMLAHLKLEEHDETVQSAYRFLKEFPESTRRGQAAIIGSAALVTQEKHDDNIKFLQPLIGKLPGEIDSQLQTFLFLSLIESERLDEAVKVFHEYDSEALTSVRLVMFHLLALKVGDKLLEGQEYRQALSILQGIWDQNDLLKAQKERLGKVEEQLKRAKASAASDPYTLQILEQLQGLITGEIETLKGIEDFDAALKLRIAQAFIGLDRYHEAAIVLSYILEKMPKSAVSESAHLQLLFCYQHIESWVQLSENAKQFRDAYPESNHLAEVIAFQAEASFQITEFSEAAGLFGEVIRDFSESSVAPRSLFMAGYSEMLSENHPVATKLFQNGLKKYPDSEYRSHMHFWLGMSLFYQKNYEAARNELAAFQTQHPESAYLPEASYRHAQSWFQERNFANASEEIEKWIEKYPDNELTAEAKNALGDSWLALGRFEEALKLFRTQTPDADTKFDYAQFRIGKTLKALERTETLKQHYQTFIEVRPSSPRVAEAINELAQIEIASEDPEAAKEILWSGVEKFGPDPEAVGVEQLLLTLERLYRGEQESDEFLSRLEESAAEAEKHELNALLARCIWIQSQILSRESPEAAAEKLLSLAELKPRELPVLILAEVANTLRVAGRSKEAYEFYRTILRWYPLATENDVAYAGLGLIAAEAGEDERALGLFDRFENYTAARQFLRFDVAKARASIYEKQERYEEALAELTGIINSPFGKGRNAAWVHVRIGDLYMKADDPRKAAAFYQRVYILYRRWPELVIRGYLGSAEAFEKMAMHQEAYNTYLELLEQEDLRDHFDVAEVKSKIATLRPKVPNPETRADS